MPDDAPAPAADGFTPPAPALPASAGSSNATTPAAAGESHTQLPDDAGAGVGGDFDFSAADLESKAGEDNDGNDTAAESPAEGSGDNPRQGEYVLTFADDSPVPEFVRGDLTRVAQELEVPADKASALYERGLAAFRTQADRQMREEGARLKEEWGDRYEANVKAVKPLMVRVLQKAGIALENAGPLKSPMGFRLMNAVREMMGESSAFAGKAGGNVVLSREQQVQDIYNDPQQLAILADPANPKWAELNAKLNHLLGLPQG